MGPFTLLILAGVLFAVALALLAAELFIPSHGILTVLCVLFAIGGVIVAYWAHPTVGLLAAIAALLVSPLVFYVAIRIYPQTTVGKHVILDAPPAQAAATAGFADAAQALEALAGKPGVALTPLRPVGMCEIDGRRIECLAESTIIDPGERIIVERVTGLKVIVRKA